MFELLIIVCVTVGFYRQARIRDKNGPIWAMIGAASYFGPKLFMARVLYAWMANPWIRSGSAAQLWLLVTVLSVGAGSPGLRPRSALLDSKMVVEKARTRRRNRHYAIGSPGSAVFGVFVVFVPLW
jgi:hypothetical protein